MAPALALLAWGVACAGERRYYECTLSQLRSGGDDLVLVLGVEDGEIRQYGLEVAGQPNMVCRMKEQGLKVDGTRLSGPMQIQVGPATEKIELDVALDKGGTYAIAYGCPETPLRVEGNVTIEEPKGAASKRWVVWLQGAPRPDTRLGLMFNLDREAKTLTPLPALASGYNRGQHPVDAAKLTFDGTNLEGELGITVVPDQWVPPHGQPVEGSIRLKATLDGKDKAGSYSAVFGIEKQRRGQVSVKPGTEAQLRALLDPLVSPQTPWRAYLVTGLTLSRDKDGLKLPGGRSPTVVDPAKSDPAKCGYTPLPPADWMKSGFDDNCWPRFQDDLWDFVGGYGVSVDPRGSAPALLHLRTCFGIADPVQAENLKLSVTCLGGAVAYVNGAEVGRGFMPAGPVTALTPAEDYPIEAYTTADNATPLPPVSETTGEPDPKWGVERYQKRVRTFTVKVPPHVLVKGRNVLAIELHRAAVAGPMGGRGWGHLGVREIKLTSPTGVGAIPYADALKGAHVWSANAVDQVTETLSLKSLVKRGWFWCMLWGRGMPVKGIQQGNPFDPVLPVRIAAPRNGVGSGQTVLSDPDGLRNVAATLEPLKSAAGTMLPATAVQVRYAVQHPRVHYCDALMEKAPEGAKTVPVWLVIQPPKDQTPGWYISTLGLEANGKKFSVPVQVLVTGLVVPDAKDSSMMVGMTESPDTVATHYHVEPWSDAHFKLLEKSFELMGQVGNDVVYVPVITSTGGTGGKSNVQFPPGLRLIRWVKTEQGLKPDFTVLEKYLDVYMKHCAPPKALSLLIWATACGREVADVYENRKIPSRENTQYKPATVQVWDPQTQTVAEQPAPALSDDGAEQFWKPMLEGVHALVTKRGWSERVIMLGLGGDVRPGQKTCELLRQWAPYARWDFLSHFSGDPGPKDGKLIATGGMEVGVQENPGTFILPTLQLEERIKQPYDFIQFPTARWVHQEFSPPILFRTLAAGWGCIGRLGLDFWLAGKGGPRSTSFFSHVNALTVPGPDGAVPTVQFQMFRESVQDSEVRAGIVRAYLKLPEDQRKPYRAVLDVLLQRIGWGSPMFLSQSELCHDWPGYVAKMQVTAAELAGVKSEAKWEEPPK